MYWSVVEEDERDGFGTWLDRVFSYTVHVFDMDLQLNPFETRETRKKCFGPTENSVIRNAFENRVKIIKMYMFALS